MSVWQYDLDALLKFGGFPELLFRQDEAEHRIWQRDRIARVGAPRIRAVKKERKLTSGIGPRSTGLIEL
ncbi:MAG TPA: hypothetical protein VFH73_19510 [Polyangia bacterium]|jgi:hypothetical protein|nr:hypothetical protein [Polyangia bacterium]